MEADSELTSILEQGGVLHEKALVQYNSLTPILSDSFKYEYKIWFQAARAYLDERHLTSRLFAKHIPDTVPTNMLIISGVITESPLKGFLDLISDQIEYLQNLNVENTEENIFYLSRSKGLYRSYYGNEERYVINPSDGRYQILDLLKKTYVLTQDIAKALETNNKNLGGQIAGIRKQIEANFKNVKGEAFIESAQRRGYRIGEKYTLNKE